MVISWTIWLINENKKLGIYLNNTKKDISKDGKKYKNKEIKELEKAVWYINRRIKELKEDNSNNNMSE